MKNRQFGVSLLLFFVGAFLLVACSTAVEEPVTSDELGGDEHHPAHSSGESMSGMVGMMHNVPEEEAAVPNPMIVTEESIETGAQLFAKNCATCHGENGEGDGVAASALQTKPANLHDNHVQSLSDGTLFYIISHGISNTPMPAWDKVLTDEERWHLVNFLRTFKDE